MVSTIEISLNGPMVLNDTEWYSMVIMCIPLALFGKGRASVRYVRVNVYTYVRMYVYSMVIIPRILYLRKDTQLLAITCDATTTSAI